MKNINLLDIIALVLVIIGAVNWGLVGLLGVDVVAAIFGVMSPFSRIVYTIVGVAGLYNIYLLIKLKSDTLFK